MPDPEDDSRRQQGFPVLMLEHLLLDHREQLVRQVFHFAVDLQGDGHRNDFSKVPVERRYSLSLHAYVEFDVNVGGLHEHGQDLAELGQRLRRLSSCTNVPAGSKT